MNSTRSADASRDVVLDSLRLSSPQGAPAGGAPRGASSKQQKDEWGEAWERLSNLGSYTRLLCSTQGTLLRCIVTASDAGVTSCAVGKMENTRS